MAYCLPCSHSLCTDARDIAIWRWHGSTRPHSCQGFEVDLRVQSNFGIIMLPSTPSIMNHRLGSGYRGVSTTLRPSLLPESHSSDRSPVEDTVVGSMLSIQTSSWCGIALTVVLLELILRLKTP
jgi:hypothetical protein